MKDPDIIINAITTLRSVSAARVLWSSNTAQHGKGLTMPLWKTKVINLP